MAVGERIKEARKRAGLTQAQLAEKSGVAAISIHQYEAGKRRPQLEQIMRIAAALNVDVNWLMNGQTLEQRDQAMKNYVASCFSYEQQCALQEVNSRNRLEAAYAKVDLIGHQRIADFAEKIAKDPKRLVDPEYPYHRRPQTAPESTPAAPQDGKDTTQPLPPPEKPTEGK